MKLNTAIEVVITLYLIIISSNVIKSDKTNDIIKELTKLRNEDIDGIISIDTSNFERYTIGSSRPYSLIIMLTASHLMEKKALKLKEVLNEFTLASKAYKTEYYENPAIFFATIEFKGSSELFQRIGVESLPFIFLISPKKTIKKTGPIVLMESEKMTLQTHRSYPWKAELISEYIRKNTGYSISEIKRPSITDSKFFLAFTILLLISTILISYKLYYTPIIQNKWIWMLAVVSVCWFATSGGLFNIIRGIPFSARSKDGKTQFFYRGQGQQLGAEGFMIGSSYVIFSSAVLVVCYGLKHIENTNIQRSVFYGAICLAAFVMKEIIVAYTLKTGYPFKQYLF